MMYINKQTNSSSNIIKGLVFVFYIIFSIDIASPCSCDLSFVAFLLEVLIGRWGASFREILDLLLCKDMHSCLILVLSRERNIANLFSEAKMANEKDIDITWSSDEAKRARAKFLSKWGRSPMVVRSSLGPKWNYQAPRWLFPPMASTSDQEL